MMRCPLSSKLYYLLCYDESALDLDTSKGAIYDITLQLRSQSQVDVCLHVDMSVKLHINRLTCPNLNLFFHRHALLCIS